MGEMKITHPDLDWRGETPVAKGYDDIYYSPDDALGEVRHNYVATIAPAFGEREIIVVGETGFGTGLNFLVTWHDWLEKRRAGDRLIFVSTEAHPLREADLRRALAPFTKLTPMAEQLVSVWPLGIPGPHRRFFDVGEERGRVELWVFYGDAEAELSKQDFLADAWYFDGFNPAENQALWSPSLMKECARLMAPGAVGGTFTVANGVRAAMTDAGLEVEKAPGFGRKRECLRVAKPGVHECEGMRPAPMVHVLGDGIAGAAICNAARQRGLTVSITASTEGKDHRASGNPAALVNFKPTKAPNEPSNRWLAACLAHVQPIYAGQWLEGRGTLKPPKDEAQGAEFAACFDAMGWSEDVLQLTATNALVSPLAGHIAPVSILAALIGDTQASDQAPNVFATAFGTLDAAPSIAPHLRRNLGQVDVFSSGPALDMPVTFGGYITPQHLAGSTYNRDPDWKDETVFEPTKEATDEIVSKAAKAGFDLPTKAEKSFVSARAFAKDHRPLVGQTEEGVWILAGLGSRGFLTAPLLAEILLDEMEGRAAAGLPTYDFAPCVHPSRFQKPLSS